VRDEASNPISVFEMLKIGIGPSSSHTLGPWRAARQFVADLVESDRIGDVVAVRVDLFGSLAKTGRGHGTGIATMMGLCDHDPETCDVDIVQQLGPAVAASGELILGGVRSVPFVRDRDVVFDASITLDGHPNAVRFTATTENGDVAEQTWFSVGGGFIVQEGDEIDDPAVALAVLPHPVATADEMLAWCTSHDISIAELVRRNERVHRDDAEIDRDLLRLRDAMLECVFRGLSTRGTLPGGLGVSRRAPDLHRSLVGEATAHASASAWLDVLCTTEFGFDDTVRLVSLLALAVNEENAAFGRVVTAPTNGAAGVLPAVLFHHLMSVDGSADSAALDAESIRFLLIAADIGAIFKKGATISAAMGGCQAEIGVSSAMAAAALTECRGGSVAQSLMAAEIAMEHHLGLTCDPIGGLVQVPCIERNAMGAMKAISAAHLAMASEPHLARVSLDDVIDTMWSTALDMSAKYKETAEGGLATRIPVSVVEC